VTIICNNRHIKFLEAGVDITKQYQMKDNYHPLRNGDTGRKI
jgi:hypothetical protein